MLARLNKEVHKLAGEGHFVESEVDSLAKFIKKKQVTLDTCVRLCHCARARVCTHRWAFFFGGGSALHS